MDRYELRRLDYSLSEDHQALQAAYKDFFGTRCTIEAVRAAEEHVVPAAPVDLVDPLAGVHPVRQVVAEDAVVVDRPDHVLDARDGVRVGGVGRPGGQVEVEGGGGVGVVDQVRAGAAVVRVRPERAEQVVVPRVAGTGVGADARVDRMERKALAADLLFGTAIAAGATAAVLYLGAPRATAPVGVGVGDGGASVAFGGRF